MKVTAGCTLSAGRASPESASLSGDEQSVGRGTGWCEWCRGDRCCLLLPPYRTDWGWVTASGAHRRFTVRAKGGESARNHRRDGWCHVTSGWYGSRRCSAEEASAAAPSGGAEPSVFPIPAAGLHRNMVDNGIRLFAVWLDVMTSEYLETYLPRRWCAALDATRRTWRHMTAAIQVRSFTYDDKYRGLISTGHTMAGYPLPLRQRRAGDRTANPAGLSHNVSV